MSELKRSGTSVVARKPSILAKTFRKPKYFECGDISRPLSLRHTAHVGASGKRSDFQNRQLNLTFHNLRNKQKSKINFIDNNKTLSKLHFFIQVAPYLYT